MLVLARKTNHADQDQSQIVIGDNIIITIVTIDRGKVQVGIEAPKRVRINRAELLSPDQLAKARKAARGE
jgi:carbon storage regulator